MKPQNLTKRITYPVFYRILLAGVLVLYGLLSLDGTVWADEAYTFALIRRSFGEIWQITAADVHPPLYYFLLKLLTAPFGYSLWVCRFLSALPMVLLLAVAGRQLRQLFGEGTAVCFLVLYAAFPYGMNSAAEVRMYGCAQLFVCLCALYAYRCWLYGSTRDWVCFALAGVCAAYTHYFALVSAGVIYGLLLLCILVSRRALWKPWCLASLATIVLYVPWLGNFFTQLVYKVNNEYWIAPITLRTVLDYGTTIFSAPKVPGAAVIQELLYAGAIVWLLVTKQKKAPLLAAAVPAATLVLGVAVSVLVRPIFVVRYLLPSIPLLIFALSYALPALNKRVLTAAVLAFAVLCGGLNGLYLMKNIALPAADTMAAVLPQQAEHEAVVVFSGNTLHVEQEISYLDPVTPIYGPEQLGMDNPYPNRFTYTDDVPEQYTSILLVTAAGAGIPEAFRGFAGTPAGTVTVSGEAHDLWSLTTAP